MSVLDIFPGTIRPGRVSDILKSNTAASRKPSLQLRFGGIDTLPRLKSGVQNVPDDQWVRRLPAFRVQGLSQHEAETHWPKLLATQAHAAQGTILLPNQSTRHYGALVVLDNGIQAFGTNLEASRQLTLCDLRLAIGTAMNHWLSETALMSGAASRQRDLASPNTPSLRQGPVSQEALPPFPKIKTIYLANADLAGDDPTPCAECQDWLNSKYCKPDTQVISLEKTVDPSLPLVRQRTVRDILPLHKARNPVRFTTERPLSNLNPVLSPSAESVLPSMSVKKRASIIRRWMQAAQQAYQENRLAPKNRTGVAIVLAPSGKLYRGSRMEWSSRWFEAADLKTAANALAEAESIPLWRKAFHWLAQHPPFQTIKSLWQNVRALLGLAVKPEANQSPSSENKIAAIAYYGDDRELPPIGSLGRLIRKGGSPNTLIATIENDVLHLRTIRDFMPELYRPGG